MRSVHLYVCFSNWLPEILMRLTIVAGKTISTLTPPRSRSPESVWASPGYVSGLLDSPQQRRPDAGLEQVVECRIVGVNQSLQPVVAPSLLQNFDVRDHPGRRKVGERDENLEARSNGR